MSSNKAERLKTGFTTGSAAAASVKGALYLFLRGRVYKSVRIRFIRGGCRDIRLHSCYLEGTGAVCTVIKDAGDDPDITDKAEIGARVIAADSSFFQLSITGGRGVGRVTKPGLEIPPGEPAITSGPKKMIAAAVNEVLSESEKSSLSVQVEIFVPQGESLAKKTLNSRLGIMGGISVLGTTGVVRPMSHQAYMATIRSSLSVARAAGLNRVFFATGRRSERNAQEIWPDDKEEAFIQIGDFFKMSLESASDMGFEMIVITAFFGKAVKMAYGIPHTHAAKSDMCMKKLSGWVEEIAGDADMAAEILGANTARQAFFILKGTCPEAIARVGSEMTRSAKKFIKRNVRIRTVIFDFDGHIIFDSVEVKT